MLHFDSEQDLKWASVQELLSNVFLGFLKMHFTQQGILIEEQYTNVLQFRNEH